jgi:hypothetical protein
MAVDALSKDERAASESGLYPCLGSPGTHRTRECVGPSFGPHAVEEQKYLLIFCGKDSAFWNEIV